MKFDEELLLSLQADLQTCRSYLKQVALGMLKGDVSKYPIFVAMRGDTDIDLGLPIVNRDELELTWSLNASHLEDFVASNIIPADKVTDFISHYKNPIDFMCVFVAEDGQTSFIFMPYDKPETGWAAVTKEQLN